MLSSSRIYDGSTDVYVFFKQFEMTAELLDWDANRQARSLPAYLAGNAERVYNTIADNDRTNYANVKNNFNKTIRKVSRQVFIGVQREKINGW